MQKLCPLVLSVARGPKALLKTSGAIFPNTDWPRLINDKFEFYLKLNERFAKRTRITSLFCSPFTFQNFRANSLQSYLLFWWPSCYRGNRYVGVNFQKFDSCIVPEVFLLLNDTSIWRLSTWLKDYCHVHTLLIFGPSLPSLLQCHMSYYKEWQVLQSEVIITKLLKKLASRYLLYSLN